MRFGIFSEALNFIEKTNAEEADSVKINRFMDRTNDEYLPTGSNPYAKNKRRLADEISDDGPDPSQIPNFDEYFTND